MIVFAGPTLDASEIHEVLDGVEFKPPARTGDIYKACDEGPKAIGLIDGFFEGVPAVWHKEILWALDRGIAVYGASSMGALRAAELHAFGMIGVGRIFEAFRDGQLEDDDEVALRHGPQALNYMALSEPMVNIRATLDSAVASDVLDQGIASKLCGLMKAMFFPNRSWDALFAHASDKGFKMEALQKFRDWLPEGRVDQKRLDALEMLALLASHEPKPANTSHAEFTFQHTAMWEDLKRKCDNAEPDLPVMLVLDQVRHDPELYQILRRRAAEALLNKATHEVPHTALDQASTRFRKEHKLYTGTALDAWLAENGLDLAAWQDSLKEDLVLSSVIAENPMAFRNALLLAMKKDGTHDIYIQEAQSKAATLHSAGFDRPTPVDLGLTPAALLMWYFEEFRDEAVPNDLNDFLINNDFSDREEFEQMMARQFVLWQEQA